MSNPFENAAAQAGGGKYITEEGKYPVTIGSVCDGTFNSGAPFAEVVFMDQHGRTIKKSQWYDGEHEKGLVGIGRLYKVCGAQFPQDGEFDPADRCRISLPALKRLEGCVLEIDVQREPSRSDPSKSYAEVQWCNFLNTPPPSFPAFTGHGGEGTNSAPAPSGSDTLFASAANSAAATDDDIPF